MLPPKVTRIYQNHHLDSTRWKCYTPRSDDIIVTTSYKSGTTFTQQILFNMLVRNTRDETKLPPVDTASPWIDARFHPVTIEELGKGLEQIKNRRFLKSHLPLDGLPYYENVKYVIVGSDPRDVFMSFFNHYANYTELVYSALDWKNPGADIPRFNDDIKSTWRNWISKGWFEWEQEGYPFWSNMHHTQTYWDYKSLPNFLFLHYADMLRDTPAAVRSIADFINLEINEDEIDVVVEATRFDNVRKKALILTEEEEASTRFFAGGTASFFFKGSNGRWKDILGEEDLAMYFETKARVLSPDCADWLENGGSVL